MSDEEEKIVMQPLDIKYSDGKFKTFTNASVITDTKFQPYLGKKLTINKDKILSVYPSEDGIGTMIHSEEFQVQTWKVIEDIDIVIGRLNE